MGVETAIIISSLIGAGGAAFAANKSKKAAKKNKLPQIGQEDAKKTTKRDVRKKGARAALVAGNVQGILNKAPTGGRGTLLGN